MCNFLSAWLGRQGEIFFNENLDSHEDIKDFFGIHADNGLRAVRVELKPNFEDIDAKWKFRVDEETCPSWATKEILGKAKTELMRRAQKMIVRNDTKILAGGRYILVGKIKIEKCVNCTIIHGGHATVKYGCNMTIEDGCNMTIEDGCNMTVKYGGHMTVKYGGHMTVKYGCNMTIENGGYMTVEDGGHATVKYGGYMTVKYGGHMAVKYGSNMTVKDGGHMTVKDGGHMTVKYGGHMTVKYGCNMTVEDSGLMR